MVIIAGYENELKECFFNYNQGLESRFTWRFKIDHYTAEDLYNIFVKKVNDIGWSIHENTIIKIEWFEKNKEYFKFYGRDIEVLLSKVKISHSKRVFCKPELEKKKITLEDLNTGLESYLKNNEMKNQKENEYFKKQLYSSIYC
jgi:SpoVK/Ycf46/Vps4 family AAA+-type ATPase